MSAKQRVMESFSERAEEWAHCYADPDRAGLPASNLFSRQRLALEMIEHSVARSSKILDAGCGTGEMVARLMERGYEPWGIDLAAPMIRHAQDHCRLDRFRVGDIEHIPFPDNTFDAVVALGVIEYLDQDQTALCEIRRVLRPGGMAIISTPNGVSPLYLMDRALLGLMRVTRPIYHALKYRLRGKAAPLQKSPQLFTRKYYRRRWLRLLRSLGLEPNAYLCHGWGWYTSPLGGLAEFLASKAIAFRRGMERVFSRASLNKANDMFVRSPLLNWFASEQIVRVRAIK
jgi:ubiquinone/menaquinone biosynthesis C-methylase UbiE